MFNDLQFLHPLLRSSEKGTLAVLRIAQKLPHVISVEEMSLVKDEWLDYNLADIPTEWSENPECSKDESMYKRIDVYWNKVTQQRTTSGHVRYPILTKLVRSVLTLAHGNADCERSLSDNKNTVTPERTLLGVDVVNGLRLAKEKVRLVNGPQNLQLSNKQIKMAQRAKSAYSERIKRQKEEELINRKALQAKKDETEALVKEKKEISMLKDKYDGLDKHLKQEEIEYNQILKTAEILLKEATAKLGKAVKTKIEVELQVAQGMLETAEVKMEKGRKGIEDCQHKRQKLSRKRKAAFDRCCNVKKPKDSDEGKQK